MKIQGIVYPVGMLSESLFQKRFSIEQCRKIYPELARLTDEEMIEARDILYDLAKMALESWKKKNPRFQMDSVGLLTTSKDQRK